MNIYNHCWLSSFYLNELKDKSWSLYPETYGNQEALFFKIQASPWGRPGPIEKAFQVHFRDHSGKNRDIKSWQIHWDSWMKWGCKIEILWRGAAKSLQSCLTLCDTIDGSLPSSPIPGILQARTLEWVAISFSNAWKWSCSVVSNPQRPHGLHPSRLLCPWDFPGKSNWSGVPSRVNNVTVKNSDYWPKNIYMWWWFSRR